ncbi:MAG TPA: hypothetical protein VMZ11_02780 [Mycobacteriales bacterium]|nr:hypothetical protein [Mycobacteriales bacterium]
MNPARRVRTVALVAAAVTAAAIVFDSWGAQTWWGLPALAVAVALSEVAVVSLQFGRQTWAFSLTESVLGAAWVVHPGAWSVFGVLVGVLVAQVALKRPTIKKQFNIAMFSCATALGSLVAGATGGHTAGAIAGLAVFFLVNHTLVAMAVAATSRRPVLPLLMSSMPLSAVHMAGNSSIGLLAAFLAGAAPLGLLGLLVPLALLWSSYDQQTRRSQEARLFAELAAGQERASGRSSDVSAQVVVTAAARLFGGADVEIVLLAADGPVRYVGDELCLPQRLRVDADVFDEPWVMRALGERGIATGVDDGRPWCSAILGDPDDPQALLMARRPTGSAPFGRREIRLAEILVGQADSWLSAADLSDRAREARRQAEVAEGAARALGDIGAATAPSLLVLRESADRLARLAESDGRVDDIIDELHMVERAVASLLGAVALAADPDLVSAEEPGLPMAARPSADWTTTGVLR